MSSIIRRRRRLIVAIWGSCPEEGRCDNPHPLRQDASAQHPRRPSRAAGSFNTRLAVEMNPREGWIRVLGFEPCSAVYAAPVTAPFTAQAAPVREPEKA